MKDNKLSDSIFSGLVFLFFLLPYVFFLKYFDLKFDLNFSELIWAVKNSLIQSVTAAVVCTLVGFIMALGIFQAAPKWQSGLLKLVLLPQILPALFSILIVLSIIDPFPMGHIGVILIFIVVNVGFVTFQFYNSIQQKISSFAVISEIYGIQKLSFFRKILLPILSPDFKLNFFFVFLFCLSSFSIPLVAGGGKGTNLEVLIFEKIFIDQNWTVACSLMIVQALMVVAISATFLKNKSYLAGELKPHRFLKSKVGLFFVLCYLGFYLLGYGYSIVKSIGALEFLSEYLTEVLDATVNSLLLLLFVLGAGYLMLWAWVLDFIKRLKHNFAIHLISVSTVLVGFSLYLFFPQTKFYDWFKIPLAFLVLFFPSLYKMFAEKKLDQIKNQILVAKIYRISLFQIVNQIILKQIKAPLLMSISLLTIWSLSDFAILRSLGSQTTTLGLLSQSFLLSYRLDVAFVISFYILIVWFAVTAIFYFFLRESNVSR